MLLLGDLHLKRASFASEAGSTIADPKQALSYRIGFYSELGSQHWSLRAPTSRSFAVASTTGSTPDPSETH